MANKFDPALMDYMFSNAYKMHKINTASAIRSDIKDDLTEKEALELSNELIQVMIKHNLSYKNCYRVSLALTTALAMGGIELYKSELSDL
jgi:hypothetical protein